MTRNGIACVEWTEPVCFRRLMETSVRLCDLCVAPETPGERCVYLFEDASGVLYVGATNRSAAVRAFRHLSNADAPQLRDLLKRALAGEVDVYCRWAVIDDNPFPIERQVIRSLKPRFNRLDWEKRNVPLLPARVAA